MRKYRGRRERKSMPPSLKMLITIAILGAVSFGIATVWQNAENEFAMAESAAGTEDGAQSESVPVTEAEPQDGPESELESPDTDSNSTSEIEAEEDVIKTASEAAKAVADKSGGDEGPEGEPINAAYAREAESGSVPQSQQVDYQYFEDAIFFGDSISTGIPLYMKTMVPNAAVIAQNGVSTVGANTSQCIDVNGTRVTMLEAAKTKGDRKKVYIMLGANALDLDEDTFIDGYRTFVQSVKELYPDAVIYVQSMLPVTAGVNKTYPSANINNQRIAEYNGSIRAMALSQGVQYVDVAQCMVNDQGMLPTDASPFDGMHLTPEYYIKWFDYLRTHTVSADSVKM